MGVGIGAGSGGWGINVSASVNAGKGSEKGNGTTRTETTVDAGNNLTIISGRDANLTGAQVSGERVTADIGHDLTICKEFPEYQNARQHVDVSHNFVTNPPAGALTTTRKNGNTIYYNPTSNTFAVKNADSVLKTMFRTDPADHGYPTNLDYLNAQK